ncbi:MAG: DUF4270 domain-containing protein [Prevotella sp.]|nr:DUF4270 domain-containing protein [Prevotella sp.]
MKNWIMVGIALLMAAISSCSEDTSTLGYSLTSDVDRFTIETDTFNVTTRSIASGSVLSRNAYSYLGRIKDPETGTYIKCDYTTQFSILESEASSLFRSAETVASRDENDLPIVDSCYVHIMINSYQGDSLAAMKLALMELEKPMKSTDAIYTDYDPEAAGIVRTANGAVRSDKIYAATDLTLSDSMRNVYRSGSYYAYIKVPLNNEYIDKNGKKYNNYGTYIMRKYYENAALFKNFNSFIRNVCPGFYIKSTDGQGIIIEVAFTQFFMYYRYNSGGAVYNTQCSLSSTDEVLKATHISYNQTGIDKLVAVDTCTYLKTPAGIYTEVTLPIDDIKKGHENDTITSAKVTFTRMRPRSNVSEVVLEEPTRVLLIEKDSLYSFFEDNGTPDNAKAYLATYNSSQKTYSFNNISYMINRMYARKGKSADWNKAVLIPVEVQTSSSTASTASGIANEMNVNSVRLVGGSANKHAPIRLSVIYNVNK